MKEILYAVVKTICQSEYTEGRHWSSAQDAKEIICVHDTWKGADVQCKKLRAELLNEFKGYKNWESEKADYKEHPDNTSYDVVETDFVMSGNKFRTCEAVESPAADSAWRVNEGYVAASLHEFKVGDEVSVYGINGNIVVVEVDGDCVDLSDLRGWHSWYDRKNVKKTGRHFPQVAELLEAMKEGAKGESKCEYCDKYQQGLKGMHEAIKKISNMSAKDKDAVFDTQTLYYIVNNYTAIEIMKKLATYEQQEATLPDERNYK